MTAKNGDGERPFVPSSSDHHPEVVDTSDASIARAAALLHAGGLVALPTETVYGLGANAADATAVARVFAAKGRPATHPLIVHLASAQQMPVWARDIPDEAWQLAEAFWPGPLTIILPRHPSVPLAVTGGRDTVALRVPRHPVAQRLLQVFGGGIAAPSANRYGRVSATTADAVVAELGHAVDLVIDGGSCQIGVESTIVEFTSTHDDMRSPAQVTVLRPGEVSAEALEHTLGSPVNRVASGPSRAPGMMASHYAPHTPVVICEPDTVDAQLSASIASGARVGVISQHALTTTDVVVAWDSGGDVAVFAQHLYAWLRAADMHDLDVVIAVLPAATGLGVAVRDRLMRAGQR
jgi:L-threonylcarbamoyladenylate synthase